MRRFILRRHQDSTGVSGIGDVAEGVEFNDGRAVTRWRRAISQTCIWDSIDHVRRVHGHDGQTEIVFVDP